MIAPPPPPEHPDMELRVSRPEEQRIRHVGEQVEFTIDVANTGTTVTAQQVQVAVKLEAGLHMDVVTTDARQRSDGTFIYTFESVPPKSNVTRKITCSCVAPVQRACAMADLIDASKLQLHDESCIQILPAQGAAGMPSALRLSVATQRNPAKVNSEVIYRITVSNVTNEPQKQVQLTVNIPENMAFVNVLNGPTVGTTIDGQKLQFSAIQELRAREQQNFDIQLRAVRPGSSKLEAELRSFNQPEPITGSEVANVVN